MMKKSIMVQHLRLSNEVPYWHNTGAQPSRACS